MKKSYDLGKDGDIDRLFDGIQSDIQKFAAEAAMDQEYDVDCPYCGKSFRMPPGSHPCPFCGESVNLILDTHELDL